MVHDSETSLYRDESVSAIVQSAKETLEPLEKRKCQSLTFEGRRLAAEYLRRRRE